MSHSEDFAEEVASGNMSARLCRQREKWEHALQITPDNNDNNINGDSVLPFGRSLPLLPLFPVEDALRCTTCGYVTLSKDNMDKHVHAHVAGGDGAAQPKAAQASKSSSAAAAAEHRASARRRPVPARLRARQRWRSAASGRRRQSKEADATATLSDCGSGSRCEALT